MHGTFKQVIVSHGLLAIKKTHKLHLFLILGLTLSVSPPYLVPMHHMIISLDHGVHSMAESVITISNFNCGVCVKVPFGVIPRPQCHEIHKIKRKFSIGLEVFEPVQTGSAKSSPGGTLDWTLCSVLAGAQTSN